MDMPLACAAREVLVRLHTARQFDALHKILFSRTYKRKQQQQQMAISCTSLPERTHFAGDNMTMHTNRNRPAWDKAAPMHLMTRSTVEGLSQVERHEEEKVKALPIGIYSHRACMGAWLHGAVEGEKGLLGEKFHRGNRDDDGRIGSVAYAKRDHFEGDRGQVGGDLPRVSHDDDGVIRSLVDADIHPINGDRGARVMNDDKSERLQYESEARPSTDITSHASGEHFLAEDDSSERKEWGHHGEKDSRDDGLSSHSLDGRCTRAVITGRIAKTFEVLVDLPGISRKLLDGSVRVRQHKNPLAACFKMPLSPPCWETIFPDPNLPLFVDIGCGCGRFLLALAKRSGGTQNYVGLEIRPRLVERALVWGRELGITNAHFILASANTALEDILSTYPGKVSWVTILCPDPHFKNKHRKRRVVQPEVVKTLAKFMAPSSMLYVASDVEEVAWDMRSVIDAHGKGSFRWVESARHIRPFSMTGLIDDEGAFEHNKPISGDGGPRDEMSADVGPRDAHMKGVGSVFGDGERGATEGGVRGQVAEEVDGAGRDRWLSERPLPLPTEREVAVLTRGGRMFRSLYQKTG
eukprot:TRINITY_DN23755_c0_g1_i1.p1 TRINITY_DN23755_c0_g1~~TRINITY_DN23755_c0_g1_i1.p1  ORF type:complete len:580 (+),score=59.52 TRINITY_DN23755_c0_g1_i1:410-2149(+)